jgi:hypothetical protein
MRFLLSKCALDFIDFILASLISGESRIVGGFSALQNHTKHQVSIRLKKFDEQVFGTGHICGGSLINEISGKNPKIGLIENRTTVNHRINQDQVSQYILLQTSSTNNLIFAFHSADSVSLF